MTCWKCVSTRQFMTLDQWMWRVKWLNCHIIVLVSSRRAKVNDFMDCVNLRVRLWINIKWRAIRLRVNYALTIDHRRHCATKYGRTNDIHRFACMKFQYELYVINQTIYMNEWDGSRKQSHGIHVEQLTNLRRRTNANERNLDASRTSFSHSQQDLHAHVSTRRAKLLRRSGYCGQASMTKLCRFYNNLPNNNVQIDKCAPFIK